MPARKSTSAKPKAGKKVVSKKAAPQKKTVRKAAPKKTAPGAGKSKPAKVAKAKPAEKKSVKAKTAKAPKTNNARKAQPKVSKPAETKPAKPAKPLSKTAKVFLQRQNQRLLILKDVLLDSMREVARDSLRNPSDGGDSSAFGQHQADAGSDTYDRDFALSMLSREQDSLYEIDEALKRIEQQTYGICEMSNKPIPKARLEALPFTRYTVECQAELEKQNRYQARPTAPALFGGSDDNDSGDSDDS